MSGLVVEDKVLCLGAVAMDIILVKPNASSG